jgi:hypothetical protein
MLVSRWSEALTAMDSVETIAGAYQVAAGRGVTGGRPLLAPGRIAHVLRGHPTSSVPETVAGLFTLCGHAHRRAAEQALAAATGGRPADEGSPCLVVETVRDHLRTIALEWPQRMPTATPVLLAWLNGSPIGLAGAAMTSEGAATALLHDFSCWLEDAVLQRAPAAWLATHDGAPQLGAWCDGHAPRLQPAAFLAALRPLLSRCEGAAHCFTLSPSGAAREAELRALGAAMTSDPLFVQRPAWLGRPAENGPWARRRAAGARAWLAGSAWTRLASRWIELVELAAAARDGSVSEVLRFGAVPLPERSAVAWCEMARGTLLHRVRLDANGGVDDWLVLAPTEWNFQPDGTLAGWIRQLPPGDGPTALALAAAFDPCVPCTVGA